MENIDIARFQSMCLNDPVMQALYRGEMSWADASEDSSPLEIDGWKEYLIASRPNAWDQPLQLSGSKRSKAEPSTPPSSPLKKKDRTQPRSPKKIPVISESDQGKRTLFIRDIPKDSTDEEIKEQLEPFGTLQRFHRSVERCFVIARFRSIESAQRAYLTKVNQFILKGKPRKLSFVDVE